jgi:hypothetical protein
MFIDATPEIPLEGLKKAINQLHFLYKKHCGGTYIIDVASKEKPVIEI